MWRTARNTVRARDDSGRIDRVAVSAEQGRVRLDFGDGHWTALTPLDVGRLRALLRDSVLDAAEAAERDRA